MSMSRVLRTAYQTLFTLLFLWLMARLAAGDPRDLPFPFLHHLDPLNAVAVVFGAGTLPGPLLWGIGLLLATLVFGRFFCGWICPLGALQHFASWVLSPRSRRESLQVNRYRRWYSTKYLILAAMLASAVWGLGLTGILDPLSLLPRGLAGAFWPAFPGGQPAPGGWLAAILLLAVVLSSRWIPRLFCRGLCPLGALLGVFARFSLFRIHRQDVGCTDCSLCTIACQGADEPLGEHRPAECHVCLNCTDTCSRHAISYRFLPPRAPQPTVPDLSRRQLVGAAIGALAVAPLIQAGGGGRTIARPRLIRPPGALPEGEFLARCVKCSLCQQACPTGAIQSAITEAGLEGFWTPVVVPRRGWCEFACTRCGEVCPTGAITQLTAVRKTGYDGDPPVRIGTAFFDFGRCLPWAMHTPCIVCEEVCPTHPKAIFLETVEITNRDGTRRRLQRPRVDPTLCVGCGICENHCPVGEKAAIRVTSVGESRNPLNRMVLEG